MRWWISVVIALLLSGCGGSMVTHSEKGGLILHTQAESIYYSPKINSHQTMTLSQARKILPELLHNVELDNFGVTQVRIGRVRLEISTRRETLMFLFKDINADVLKVPRGIFPDLFAINLTDKAQILFRGASSDLASDDYIKSVADALYALQQAAMHDADDVAFSQTARAYREAATKPVLPEAARRLRAQVEDAVQDKNFENAADLCLESTRLVPWWPDGHFNCAVVLSETGDYGLAVREMKRYLLLVPDAPDAHEAQNYVYKWERKAGMPN